MLASGGKSFLTGAGWSAVSCSGLQRRRHTTATYRRDSRALTTELAKANASIGAGDFSCDPRAARAGFTSQTSGPALAFPERRNRRRFLIARGTIGELSADGSATILSGRRHGTARRKLTGICARRGISTERFGGRTPNASCVGRRCRRQRVAP